MLIIGQKVIFDTINPIINECEDTILIEVIVSGHEVDGVCGVFEFSSSINILRGEEFIRDVNAVIIIEGQESGSCSNSLPLFYIENFGFANGKVKLSFYFDGDGPCGDDSYFTREKDFYFTTYGCSEIKCSSAFDWCSWIQPHDNSQLLLNEVYYNDPTYGPQMLDENNTWGIFHFPYYNEFVDWNFCNIREKFWHEDTSTTYPKYFGLCQFVSDMNEFLSLSSSGISGTENLTGRLDIHSPHPITPGYCKKYFKFMNTGVFFYKFQITFFRTVEDTCQMIYHHDEYEYPTPTYPPSYACVQTAYTIGSNENSYFYSDFELKKTLNISEEDKNDMYCYPSITSSEFKISNAKKLNLSISIFSISGQLMDEINMNNTSKKIDISDYIAGLYIVKIKDMQNGIIKTEKIIKQ